jgi:hypothetical protein
LRPRTRAASPYAGRADREATITVFMADSQRANARKLRLIGGRASDRWQWRKWSKPPTKAAYAIAAWKVCLM